MIRYILIALLAAGLPYVHMTDSAAFIQSQEAIKDKHDCFILSSEGEVMADVFTIPNNERALIPFCDPFFTVSVRTAK